MDKNGKLFNRINIIDFGIILLIIVFIAGIGIRLFGSTSATIKNFKTFEYTVIVSDIRSYSVDALKKLGNVTDKTGDKILGDIIDVESEPFTTQFNTLDGAVKETVMPEKYICKVKIRTTGKEGDDFYFAPDNTELSVGKKIDVFTKYIHTSGIINDIQIVE